MTGFEFCKITAPSPFLEASVCNIVSLLGLKYGRVTFLEISSFVLRKSNMHRFCKLEFSVLPADLSERVHLTLLNMD